MMKEIMIFILLILFSGCIFVSRNLNDQKLDKIKPGMTQEEVIETMGRPIQTKMLIIRGQEYQVWKYSTKQLWAGKFNSLGDSYYEILFLDGKVSRWNKSKVYAQPKYEVDIDRPAASDVLTLEIFREK